jgi:Tubulin binding cofactor C
MQRKKTVPHSPGAALINSPSAIVAGVTHSLQRETHLVASNMTAILTTIAATYGILPQSGSSPAQSIATTRSTAASKDSPPVAPRDAEAALSIANGTADGTVSPPGSGKLQRSSTAGCESATTSESSASAATSTRASAIHGMMISRSLFEHLSFLLTTTSTAGDTRRSISCIVPEWRDSASTDAVPLGRLVQITTAALTYVAAEPGSGPIDTAEIRDLERKTIIRSRLPVTGDDDTSDFPHGREVRITNCSESFVYLMCSLGRVSLIGCREVTLFVGSCVSVSIIGCDRVRVHTIARVCRVANCFDTTVYLCTNRRPQIVGDNRGIVFAPYNAAYPYIKRDLAAVGVDPTRNKWDTFYCPTPRASGGFSTDEGGEVSPSIVSILPAQRFLPFAVPVALVEGDSSSPSAVGASSDAALSSSVDLLERDPTSLRILFTMGLPLPAEYQAAIDERRQLLESLLEEVNNIESLAAPAPTEQRGETGFITPPSDAPSSSAEHLRVMTHTVVHDRFRDWLISSNRLRQVHDLVRLDPETKPAEK